MWCMCIFTNAYMFTYVYPYIYMYMPIYMYVCIYINIQIYQIFTDTEACKSIPERKYFPLRLANVSK